MSVPSFLEVEEESSQHKKMMFLNLDGTLVRFRKLEGASSVHGTIQGRKEILEMSRPSKEYHFLREVFTWDQMWQYDPDLVSC